MSKFLILPLSVLTVAMLGACGSRQPAPVVVVPQSPPATVVNAPKAEPSVPMASAAASIRPGFGRIESMAPVPATASTGSSAPSAMNRLNVRMDDGTAQLVDSPSAGLQVGDRVELTREGYIRRIPQ
jgi:hypothetical protein